MFWAVACLFFALDICLAPYIDRMTLRSQLAMSNVMVFVVALCGLYGIKQPSSGTKSTMVLVVAYTGFSALYFPIWFKSIAAAVCLGLVMWVWSRPTNFVSDEPTTENVMLAFYSGDHGSLIMLLSSLIGLPVRSMSVVVGNEWLKLSTGVPVIESVDVAKLDPGKYVLIDTGVKIDERIRTSANGVIGQPARNADSLWMRVRCIASIAPLLKVLGDKFAPVWPWDYIPSIYFYRCLDRKAGDK